jgi:hypothetical protein
LGDINLPTQFFFSPIECTSPCESPVNFDPFGTTIVESHFLFYRLMMTHQNGWVRELEESEGVGDPSRGLQFEERLVKSHVLRR